MGRFGLALLIVVLLLGGCRKAAKTPAKPAETRADGAVDEFGLPLVIRVEVPEAPSEIQKPSPPIPKEPESH